MGLTAEIMDVSDASMSTLDYVSGKVVAKSFNKDKMTVEFINLKMAGKTFIIGQQDVTYTFNGTATIQF